MQVFFQKELIEKIIEQYHVPEGIITERVIHVYNRILLDLVKDTSPPKCQKLIRTLMHNMSVQFVWKRKIIRKELDEKDASNSQNVEQDYVSVLALKYNKNREFLEILFCLVYLIYYRYYISLGYNLYHVFWKSFKSELAKWSYSLFSKNNLQYQGHVLINSQYH